MPRPVGRVVVHAQIERMSMFSPDDLNSSFRKEVREISVNLHRLVVLKQIHDPGSVLVSEVIFGASDDPKEFLISVPGRIELWSISAMPFSSQSRFVTVRLEP